MTATRTTEEVVNDIFAKRKEVGGCGVIFVEITIWWDWINLFDFRIGSFVGTGCFRTFVALNFAFKRLLCRFVSYFRRFAI